MRFTYNMIRLILGAIITCLVPSKIYSQTVYQAVPGQIYVGQTAQFVYNGGCPASDITWRLEVNGAPDTNGTITSGGTYMGNATWSTPSYGVTVIAWCSTNTPLTAATAPFDVINSPPGVPTATQATDVTRSSFTANWVSVNNATGYQLDVSESNTFSSFVSGFHGLAVSGTSKAITGLPVLFKYFYRLRSVSTTGVSPNSNIVTVVMNDQNYVRTEQALVENIKTEDSLNSAAISEKSTVMTFLDGLGRSIQTIHQQGSPSLTDIVQPITYDAYGRERFKYLPFAAGADGWYKPTRLIIDSVTGAYIGIAQSFYSIGSDNNIADDLQPYSETIFETSPLNRVIKQGLPGAAWQPDNDYSYTSPDHSIKTSYGSNSANEVLCFKYTYPTATHPLGHVVIGKYMHYPANQLHKTKTKDEDQNESIEFVGKDGRTVLKKVQLDQNTFAETCYVYDDFGNLVTVFSPEATKRIKARMTLPSITWTEKIGVTVGADNSLTKTTSSGWSEAYSSIESLKPGVDGWVEAVAQETDKYRVIGLAAGNRSSGSIDFGILLSNDGHVYVSEWLPYRMQDLGTYSAGTVVRVSREGSKVKYYVNGILRSTSPTLNTGTLYVNAAIYHTGGTIKAPKTSFGCDVEIQQALNNLAFRYAYDSRNRTTQKLVPGAGVVYMVYDNNDRLTLTQDANQRSGSVKYWTFTKYDLHDRPIMTGIKDTSANLTQAQMQAAVNSHYLKNWAKRGETFIGSAQGNVHGYSNKSYPVVTTSNTIDIHRYLSVTYYDNYAFKSILNDSTYYSFKIDELPGEQESSYSKRLNGQITGTKVKVLDVPVTSPGGYSWLKTVNYYDSHYRVIQTISDNIKAGHDLNTNVYDFVDKLLKTKATHTQYDVTWKQVGTPTLTATGNKLSGGGSAASNEILLAGQDGWIEAEYPFFSSSITGFGLSAIDDGAGISTIDYCFRTATNITTLENNGFSGPTSVANPGDRLKIERIGTTIKYYINNALFHTSTNPSSSSLLIDLYSANNVPVMLNIRASFAKTSDSVTKPFEYDHAGRLVNTWHKVNDGLNILLVSNLYNELGQLVDKKLHSTQSNASDARQSLDFAYNIRGWLESLNNAAIGQDPTNESTDYFGFELGYNKSIGNGNPSHYNGNISGMKWSNALGVGEIRQNGYVFSYDRLNRLKGATFKQAVGDLSTLSWSVANGNALSESGILYDLNGNIQKLSRRGQDGALVDSLTYDYGSAALYSNRLLKVTDFGDDNVAFKETGSSSNDYEYDANGNLRADNNKGGGNVLINGGFDDGSANWSVSDNGSRLTFSNGSLSIASSASAVASISQYNCIQPNLTYYVTVDWERTSATETINVGVGNIPTILGTPGVSSFTVTPTSGTSVQITFGYPSFSGKINSIEVVGFTTIANNDLNLPQTVSMGAKKIMKFVYDASGRKLSSEVYDVPNKLRKRTDYVGEFFYENDTLKYISHTDGRVVITDTIAEYQYTIKDIWNNSRLTFTTIPSEVKFSATLESATQGSESAGFQNYSSIDWDLFDHTDAGSAYTRSQLLNGGYDSQVGLAKSLSVMPGDTISVDVFAKYRNLTSTPGGLGSFASALTAAFGLNSSMAGDPGFAYDALDAYGSIIAGGYDHSDSVDAPKAYLNILLFDRDYNFVDAAYRQIGIDDVQGDDPLVKDPHGHLRREVIVPVAGYAYIFLSNENPTQVDVYFDDLIIVHSKSPIIQTDDYYPLGLTFNSYRREGQLENKIKFQGQERISDLGLEWDAFKYRNYMPDIGRFFNVDPLADKYVYNSPYAFAENKLGRGVELEGLELASFLKGAGNAILTNHHPTQAGRGAGRETAADKRAYDAGQRAGDLTSLVIGLIEIQMGGTAAAGGIVAAPETGGLSLTGSLVGLYGMAQGTTTGLNGGRGLLEGRGSYTNRHESGKRYHGKGDKGRAQDSAKKIEKEHGDPLDQTDYSDAPTDREAFKDEYKRLQEDGGPENPNNYNKRQSPGKKYTEEDGASQDTQ